MKTRLIFILTLFGLFNGVAFAPEFETLNFGAGFYPPVDQRVYLDPADPMLKETIKHFSLMGGKLCRDQKRLYVPTETFYMQMPKNFNPKIFRHHSTQHDFALRGESATPHASFDGHCRYQFWNFNAAYDEEKLPQNKNPFLGIYQNAMQDRHQYYKGQESGVPVFMVSNPDKVDEGDLSSFAFTNKKPLSGEEAEGRYFSATGGNEADFELWQRIRAGEQFLDGQMMGHEGTMENCACKLLPVGQAIELETSPILFPQVRGSSSLPRAQGFGRFMGGFDGATSGSGVRGAALNTVLGDGAGDLAEIATDPQNRPYYAPTAIAARAAAQRLGLAAGGLTLLGNGTTGVMSGSKTGVAGPAVLITGAIILYDKIDEFMHEYEFCVMRQIDAKYLHETVLNKWAQRKGRARAQGLPFNEPRPSDDRMSVPWQNWNNYWHYAYH